MQARNSVIKLISRKIHITRLHYLQIECTFCIFFVNEFFCYIFGSKQQKRFRKFLHAPKIDDSGAKLGGRLKYQKSYA